MSKKKTYLAVVLMVVMALTLTSCGKAASTNKDKLVGDWSGKDDSGTEMLISFEEGKVDGDTRKGKLEITCWGETSKKGSHYEATDSRIKIWVLDPTDKKYDEEATCKYEFTDDDHMTLNIAGANTFKLKRDGQ